MDPFHILETRGHIMEDGDTTTRSVSHSGPNDDYDLSRGPARSLTARSDKALTMRDLRMPGDLMRSRRVGLTRMACPCCSASMDQGVCRHDASCSCDGRTEFVRQTTGPMLSKETSKDVGWR